MIREIELWLDTICLWWAKLTARHFVTLQEMIDKFGPQDD
jgi:hypothetical protein